MIKKKKDSNMMVSKNQILKIEKVLGVDVRTKWRDCINI